MNKPSYANKCCNIWPGNHIHIPDEVIDGHWLVSDIVINTNNTLPISSGFFYYPAYKDETAVEKLFKESQQEKIPDTERLVKKCDCGGESSGCNSHSDWCSTKQ